MKKFLFLIPVLLLLAVSRPASAQAGLPVKLPEGFGSGITRWINPLASATTFAASLSAANQTRLWSFQLGVPVTFSHIVFNVQTADTTAGSLCGAFADCYSVAIYSVDAGFPIWGTVTVPAGTLLANCSAQAFNTAGALDCTTTQGSQTLQPGNYYFALTGTATTAAITVSSTNISFASNALPTAGGTTTNGVPNSSFTPPADSWNLSSQRTVVFALHN